MDLDQNIIIRNVGSGMSAKRRALFFCIIEDECLQMICSPVSRQTRLRLESRYRRMCR